MFIEQLREMTRKADSLGNAGTSDHEPVDSAASRKSVIARRPALEAEIGCNDLEMLARELDKWPRGKARFWWRDDDATGPSASLDRLLGLRAMLGLPLALSVIPAAVDPVFPEALLQEADIGILQHGWDHTDHGGHGRRKAELSERRLPLEVFGQLTEGRRILTDLFGSMALPVLVAPYDYLARNLVDVVRRAGFRHVSLHGDFTLRAIAMRNVHGDVIDWDEERVMPTARIVRSLLLALRLRRFGIVRRSLPIGIKTHHLQHDEEVWQLTETLLQRLRRHPAVSFPSIEQVFA